MKILWGSKDGGPESNVRMWGFESKMLGSILLLCFGRGSREAFHTHAFNSWSWVLSGELEEIVQSDDLYEFDTINHHWPRSGLVRTYRTTFHQVRGLCEANWALTIRGPRYDTWRERLPLENNRIRTLTHGRKEVK